MSDSTQDRRVRDDPRPFAIRDSVLPELTNQQIGAIYARREALIREVRRIVCAWPDSSRPYPLAVDVERVHALLSEWRLIADMLYGDDISIRAYAAQRAPDLDPKLVLDTTMDMFGGELGRSAAVIVEQVDRAIARIRGTS
jgi:hypothetical protein